LNNDLRSAKVTKVWFQFLFKGLFGVIFKKVLFSAALGASLFATTALVTSHDVQAQGALHESLSVTLEQAVASGVLTNPEFGVVAANRRATDEELRQGRALYYPSLDLSGDTGFEHTDNATTRAANPTDGDEDLHRSQANLTLTQMLFDGFEAKYEVARQQARVESAAHRVRETVELVGVDIVEAYLNVLRQRYLLSIADENVADHENILNQITDGVTGGRSTQADLQQARARLASAKATRADTLEAMQNAEADYLREVGDEAGKLVMPTVPYGSLMETVDEEVRVALASSPSLEIYSSDIEAAYAEARQARESYYPEFDLQLSGSQSNDVGGLDDHEKSARALVTMNWNLYRGGADVARVREFTHRHSQAKESRAQAARQLENDIRQTWSSMIAAGTRAAEFRQQANANEEVVNAYKDQFNLNRRTLLDVLDSQNELFVSKSNAVNAEFLQMFSVYRLLGLRGGLFATLGLDVPSETVVSQGERVPEKIKSRAY
jgi:adhesin transport system outer membrane protein